jgi:PEP-CTERM/exosortase A-associated glycosyltransferase
MRILHVLDHSVPLQSGYAFRTLAILKEQRARGWDTIQLTSPKHTRPYRPVETVDGWSFARTPPVGRLAAALPLVRELALMRATERRLDALAAETRPDILHAHSPVLNAVPALRVGRRRGIPVVYEIRAFWEDAGASHGTAREHGPRYRAIRFMETTAVRAADEVTVICEGLRSDLVARGIPPGKITVIPNAVDPAEFPDAPPRDAALAAELGLAGASVLGFLGSFYSYEGLDLAIAAMPAILAARPDARLLLVGGGPESERLRALARRIGVADKVVFPGRVPHDAVRRYYGLVDVLVYPRVSIRLTELVTPLKPLEAMAQGKLVLASDVGGHRELIRDAETGHLFRAGDAGALAEAALRVLAARQDWPRILANGRRFVAAERAWAASVARYEEVYARALARRKR